jgi:ABC-type antimicrobial peptide transport system permease subunit
LIGIPGADRLECLLVVAIGEIRGRTLIHGLQVRSGPAMEQAHQSLWIMKGQWLQQHAVDATVALLLGVVGIYGVVAYMATQRTREIGIRMALGAQIRDVRTMFLGHGLRLMATGIALGVAVALVLTRVMSGLLFGIGSMDPMTYASVSAALAAVGWLATYLPARRASRVDPVVALHADV